VHQPAEDRPQDRQGRLEEGRPEGHGPLRLRRQHPGHQRQHGHRRRFQQRVRLLARRRPPALQGRRHRLQALRVRGRQQADRRHELAVGQVDPNTGKPKFTFQLEANWEVDKVYSVDPLVVSATQREQKKWTIFSLDANGRLRSTIQGGNDKFAPSCGGSFVIFGKNLQGCTGVAADANTFYMSTETDYGKTNEVVAYDLKTGKAKWRAKAPEGRKVTPLRMEGSDVLLYMQTTYDKGGAVATLAPTGGAPKILLQHPASTSEIESSFYSPGYAYGSGTFVVAAGRVSASNDKEEMQVKTMMAFSK
jgi:hypothetical protein